METRTFQSKITYDAGTWSTSAFCADLDGDSDMDLVVANYYSVSVLENNGDGSYQPRVDYGAGWSPIYTFCTDLDGDGDLDIAAANAYSDNVSVFMNLSQVPGNSPPYHFSLVSPADGSDLSGVVNFDWTTACDPNLGDQIRYDLHISTSSQFLPEFTSVYSNLSRSQACPGLDPGQLLLESQSQR